MLALHGRRHRFFVLLIFEAHAVEHDSWDLVRCK
jgi:hypothetical protein